MVSVGMYMHSSLLEEESVWAAINVIHALKFMTCFQKWESMARSKFEHTPSERAPSKLSEIINR